VLDLKLNRSDLNRSKSNLSIETKSPKPVIVQLKSPHRSNFKGGDEAMLEQKLRESERLNKEYQQEIKAMQRI
jgi:hypothetical protein